MERMTEEEKEKYIKEKEEKRESEDKTQREFLAATYNELVEKFGEYAKQRFKPLHQYGVKEGTRTHKLSYPASFKRYFFEQYKAVVKTREGEKHLKHCPPGFWLSGNGVVNRRVKTRQERMKRYQKLPPAFVSRVWRRTDKNPDRA